MEVKELVYPAAGTVPYLNAQHRTSWGAILAGAFVSLACLLTMGLLGVGIGLLAAPAGSPGAAGSLTGGAVAWWFVSSIVSFTLGGWFAGRLTGVGRVSESVLHGVASWGVVTVAVAFFLTFAAGKTIGGAAGLIGGGLGGGLGGASYGMPSGPSGEDLRDVPGRLGRERRPETRAYAPLKPRASGAMPEAPASLSPGLRTTAETAGTFSLVGFFVLLVQAFFSAAGARAGTRVLVPASQEALRR